jgi:hypothetical protein
MRYSVLTAPVAPELQIDECKIYINALPNTPESYNTDKGYSGYTA